jgi:ABC-2 type transport system permease protein
VAHGGLVVYPLATVIGGAGGGLLVALMFAALGVLVSLRASTVKQAQQRYSIALALLAGIPAGLLVILVILVPRFVERLLTPLLGVLFEGSGGALLALLGVGMLLFLDVVFITLAMARFKRAQLIL